MRHVSRRGIVVGLGAVALAALGWLGLRPRPVPVEVGEVVRETFVEVVEEEGRTRARERFVVSAPVHGLLARVALDPGDAVEADQTVATLAPVQPPLLDTRTEGELQARLLAAQAARRTAVARVERAEAEAEFSERERARLDALVARGASAPQELERLTAEAHARAHEVEAARFASRMAAHEVTVARAALRQAAGADGASGCCDIRSPVGGVVLRLLQESEAVVTPGQPLLEIGDPGDLEVVVDLLTQDAARVRPGAPARLTRWGGEGTLRARVRRVEPSARTKVSALGVEEQRVDVILDLAPEAEAPRGLGDGYRVDAAIEVQRLPDSLVVPAGALFRQDDTWAVYRLEAGRARRREVVLGPRSDREAVVESGLGAGDRVILHPTDEVADGVRVTP